MAQKREVLMNSLLFLGLCAGVIVLAGMQQSNKVRAVLKQHSAKISAVPKMVSVLILTAQISELIKMIDHVSIVNVTASLFLLVIMIAAKSGTYEIGHHPLYHSSCFARLGCRAKANFLLFRTCPP